MSVHEKILFKTEVGSNMWGMSLPDSDVDVMTVYQQDTKEILSGYPPKLSFPSKKVMVDDKEHDIQYMEIGHLINLLIKGNCNALWAVTTPVIIQDSPVLEDLKYLTYSTLSKAPYQSIRGIAYSQLLDSDRRKGVRDSSKSLKTSLRSILFGINLFTTGTLKYLPIQHETTQEEVKAAFLRLDDAYAHSTLPEKPDEQRFRTFLYEVRTGKKGD